MKSKKHKILLLVGIFVFVIGIVIGVVCFSDAIKASRYSLSQLCPEDRQVQYLLATISRREGESGHVTDLWQASSEDRDGLGEEVFLRLHQFSFSPIKNKAQSQDFISVSLAYDENTVLRFEIYRDNTVLVIGGESAGLYEATQNTVSGDALYDLLYSDFTDEAPR